MRFLVHDSTHVLTRYRWWDLRTRQMTSSIQFSKPVTSMELSPQTGRLVVTSGNTVAFIPALPRNNVPSHTLTLPYTPSSASIHPILQDRFVTGSLTDEWVRVHGIDGEEREVLKGHHGPVHCVEFSPDGEMYGSGSEDGALVTLVISYIAPVDLTWNVSCRYDTTMADDARQIIWFMARTTLMTG